MKIFETPELEIVEFAVEDVITVSGEDPVDPTPGGNGTPIS